MKWYYYLKPTENKRALLEEEKPTPTSLIVCHESESRRYTQFENYLAFYKFFDKIHYKAKTYHEIILGMRAQKIYFDLDMDLFKEDWDRLPDGVPILPDHQAEEEEAEMCISLRDSELVLLTLIDLIKSKISQALNNPKLLKSRDILVFSSHGRKKRSYHVVVDKWCVNNHLDNKFFTDSILSAFPARWRWCIDPGTCKSMQSLRIYGSHKYGSHRTKILDPKSKFKPPIANPSDKQLFLFTLGASLISNTSSCKTLPIQAPKPEKNYISQVCSNPEVNQAVQSLKDGQAFTIGSIQGGIISLIRHAPTWCDACKRTHEAENPYLIIVGYDRNVYFCCRRSKKKTYVCSLGNTSSSTPPQVIEEIKEESEPEPEYLPNPPQVKTLQRNTPPKESLIVTKPTFKSRRRVPRRTTTKHVNIVLPPPKLSDIFTSNCSRKIKRKPKKDRADVAVEFLLKPTTMNPDLCLYD